MTITETRPASAGEDPAPTAVLVSVDPQELVLEENVRGERPLDKRFVASIRDLGVLVPVSAWRGEQGEWRVLLGKQRTRAAREAGLTAIPVYVVDAPDEEKARQVARIIEQLAENDDRTGLPDVDRVEAYQQLSLLGLSATTIARRTHVPVKTVKAGLAVVGSVTAVEALREYDVTLDQAAVIAELAGDADGVDLTALTEAARKAPEQFEHVAQQIRDTRAAAAARAAAVEQLTAAGVRVVDPPEQPYGLDTSSPLRRLSRLKPAGEPDGTDLTEQAHADCIGHAAFVDDRGAWHGTAELVPVFVCTDWRVHGHEEKWTSTSSTRGGGPMSDEQKLERQQVIAGNRAWDSAQSVRRRWLKTFLARKAAPKHAPQWIVMSLAGGAHEIRRAMEGGHQLALELLGLTTGKEWTPWSGQPHPLITVAQTATPARAGVLTLAMLLAGIEKGIDRQAWRQPTSTLRSYLTALEGWGYALSDIERSAATEVTEHPAADNATDGTDSTTDNADAVDDAIDGAGTEQSVETESGQPAA